MITAPTFSKRGAALGYRDARDPEVTYVDALRPSAAARWRSLPGGEALLAAEARFGPDEAEAGRFAQGSRRALPMPWEVSPVYAWAPEGDGVRLLARGTTSGFSAHNAVLSATTGGHLSDGPVAIAAALHCRGLLAGAHIEGGGDAGAARELLRHAPLGARAAWGLTLGEALALWLRELLSRRVLTLRADAFELSLDGVEDLRSLALAEWAQRVALAWFPQVESLALPAALAARPADGPLDLQLAWRAGDRITLRAVRALTTAGRSPAALPAGGAPPIRVKAAPASAWDSFDFVRVELGEGDAAGEVTLSRAEPEASWAPGRPPRGALRASAHGAARGYGVLVPLKHTAHDGEVTVGLEPLEERALLVRAERELLRRVGPISVELGHAALAHALTPREGAVALRPEDGDLRMVSAPYRALLWRRRARAPFTVTARLADGREATWRDPARGDEIVIDEGVFGPPPKPAP